MKSSQDDDAREPGLMPTTQSTEANDGGKPGIRAERESRDRLDYVFRVLRMLMDNKFTGFIKLNFSQGTLGRVEKFEEILKK
jgi:hypothetical protein